MRLEHWRASGCVVAASVGLTGWVSPAAAFDCTIGPPSLAFHYPAEETGVVPRGALFWAVGTAHTVILGAFLDGGRWLEPAGAEPPENWMIVPPADLAPGGHILEFEFEDLEGDGDDQRVVRFEVSETAAAEPAVVTPLSFGEALRFPSFEERALLHAEQRDALLLEREERIALAGDCTPFVDAQFDYCFWNDQSRSDLGMWLEDPERAPALWTAFTTAGDALGFIIADRFVPRDCRGVVWGGEGVRGGIRGVPIYATGLGASISLDEQSIATYQVLPPPSLRYSTPGCAFAPQGATRGQAMSVVVAVSCGVLAGRRRRAVGRRPAA